MSATLSFCFGFIVGGLVVAFIFLIIRKSRIVGKLRIDRSDPEDGPYMFLELSKSINQVESKKHIVLEVKSEDFIPHK